MIFSRNLLLLGVSWYYGFPQGLYHFDSFTFRAGRGGHADGPAELTATVRAPDPAAVQAVAVRYPEGYLLEKRTALCCTLTWATTPSPTTPFTWPANWYNYIVIMTICGIGYEIPDSLCGMLGSQFMLECWGFHPSAWSWLIAPRLGTI